MDIGDDGDVEIRDGSSVECYSESPDLWSSDVRRWFRLSHCSGPLVREESVTTRAYSADLGPTLRQLVDVEANRREAKRRRFTRSLARMA